MSRRVIRDKEVRLLASKAGCLQADYADHDADWEGSPFAWIKARPSRQVGKIGEQLVSGWCAAKGLDVTRAASTGADRNIGGREAEIKFSTLWRTGRYKFQQLRDQDYEIAILLGVSPFDAHCWVVPKRVLMARWGKPDGPQSQHGGRAGSDTAWLEVDPAKPQKWLDEFGGSLAKGLAVLVGG